MRGICERVEHHLWSSDARPAYRGIQALHSVQSHPRCMSVKATGEVLSEEDQVRARWADYFEQLYKADPPVHQIDVSDDPQVCDASPVDTAWRAIITGNQKGRGTAEKQKSCWHLRDISEIFLVWG